MKYFLFTILGMFLMFVILKTLGSKTVVTESQLNSKIFKLVASPKFSNLLKTNEARELIKSPEFKAFTSVLAKEQLQAFSSSLVNYESKL